MRSLLFGFVIGAAAVLGALYYFGQFQVGSIELGREKGAGGPAVETDATPALVAADQTPDAEPDGAIKYCMPLGTSETRFDHVVFSPDLGKETGDITCWNNDKDGKRVAAVTYKPCAPVIGADSDRGWEEEKPGDLFDQSMICSSDENPATIEECAFRCTAQKDK